MLDTKKNNKEEENYFCFDEQRKPDRKGLSLAVELGPLLPIGVFEILVISMGTAFYMEMGFEFYYALAISFCIEYFYMVFSAKPSLKYQVGRLFFFGISFFTLCFNSYNKDADLINKRNLYEASIQNQKEMILKKKQSLESTLANLGTQEKDLRQDMETYRKFDRISKGTAIVSSEYRRIGKERASVMEDYERINNQFEELKNKKTNLGFLESLKYLRIQTIIVAMTIACIQIGICIVLPDLLGALSKN